MRTYKGWSPRKLSFDVLNKYGDKLNCLKMMYPQTSPNSILTPLSSSTQNYLIIEKGIVQI